MMTVTIRLALGLLAAWLLAAPAAASAQDAGSASGPAPEGAGQGAMRATKVADPGRSIFVVGPGLAAGAEP